MGGLAVDTTSRSYEVGQGIVVTAGGAFEVAAGAGITLVTAGWGGAVGIPLIVDGWFTGQQGVAMIFGDPIPPNPLHDAFVGALEGILGLSEAEAEFVYGFGKGFGTLYGLYICRPTACPEKRGYGNTPEGRPYTKHYATETGPQRNIPGSVVDHTINTTKGVPVDGGKIVHYDPVNNVTVVTGDGGSIVSVHKGAP